MNYRSFGRHGLRVSDLFLRSVTFGENWGWWGSSQDERRKIVSAYLDAGGNVIDTASGYTDDASEQILGELIHGAADLVPGEMVDELDTASAIDPTFPYDFIASTAEFVYAPVGACVQP